MTQTPVAPQSKSLCRARSQTQSTATDVWYFLRPLDSSDPPAVWPAEDDEPIIYSKPQKPFVGCKLCRYVIELFPLSLFLLI